MGRPKITVTNMDRTGKVTDEWHVRVGNRWRTFTEKAWAASGIKYLNEQIRKAS